MHDGSFVNQNQLSTPVIRDKWSNYKGSGQARGIYTSCALDSEFQALIMAMQHVWSKAFRKFIFASDYKQMIDIPSPDSMLVVVCLPPYCVSPPHRFVYILSNNASMSSYLCRCDNTVEFSQTKIKLEHNFLLFSELLGSVVNLFLMV